MVIKCISDIKEIQRIYKSIQLLPINNEKYLNVLKKQIPFFIQSVTGKDALFHYCDISVDLDYPLIDGIPLYHDMYHLRGTDLVLYYLKRLSEENHFCSLFDDLETFIEDYEKTIKTSVYDLQINFFELVVHQCITHISIYNSPGLIIHEEYTAFMSSLTAIEIVSILKLIIPELDTFLHSTSIADIISELDTSITYQEILSHYITTEVLNTYPQYIKKEGSF